MSSIAVRATPIAALDKSVAVRVTGASVALGLLLAFAGAFGLDDDPWLLRMGWIAVISFGAAVLNILAYQAALSLRWTAGRYWARIGVAAALVAPAMAGIIWVSLRVLGGRPGLAVFLIATFNAFVVGVVFVAAFVAPAMEASLRRAKETAESLASKAATKFADRLPLRLRNSEIWGLRAEDHYLRVYTANGEAQIRLRLTDALRELGHLDGAQTHRSWWVARPAIREIRRTRGRVVLVLHNGVESPVSRAAASRLQAAGWLSLP